MADGVHAPGGGRAKVAHALLLLRGTSAAHACGRCSDVCGAAGVAAR